MNIHPSQFETPDTINVKNEMVFKEISGLRETRIVDPIENPKKFDFIEESSGLTGSNTRHLFKNLYGETLLTFLFFSEKNVNNLQDVIRHLIYKETKRVIDKQNHNDLLIIMRSIFLEYHRHPLLFDENTPQEQIDKLLIEYTAEVSRLNELVINDVVPRVLSGFQQYLDYLHDASTQPIPISRPKNTSVTGSRIYKSVTSVLLGTEL